MQSFIRGEPDVVTRWSAALLVAGLLLGPATAWFDLPGVITAMFLIYLGAAAGSLVRWRDERGLWMLAALWLVISVVIYGLFAFGQIRDIVRGAPQAEVSLIVDFTLGTMLLSVSCRFLSQVARYNRSLPEATHDA